MRRPRRWLGKSYLRYLSISLILLLTGTVGIMAQDVPVQILEGTALPCDSVSIRPSGIPMPFTPVFGIPLRMTVPSIDKTGLMNRRAGFLTPNQIMQITSMHLNWGTPSKIPKVWEVLLKLAALFLTNPCAVPEGYMVLDSSSPYILMKIPGMAPLQNPYSLEQIPMWIRTEYNYSTGKYEQVMVEWSEVQFKMNNSNIEILRQTLPVLPPSPADRFIH